MGRAQTIKRAPFSRSSGGCSGAGICSPVPGLATSVPVLGFLSMSVQKAVPGRAPAGWHWCGLRPRTVQAVYGLGPTSGPPSAAGRRPQAARLGSGPNHVLLGPSWGEARASASLPGPFLAQLLAHSCLQSPRRAQNWPDRAQENKFLRQSSPRRPWSKGACLMVWARPQRRDTG